MMSGTSCKLRRVQLAKKVKNALKYLGAHNATVRLDGGAAVPASVSNSFRWALSLIFSVLASGVVSAGESHGPSPAASVYTLDVRSSTWAQARLFKKSKGEKLLYSEAYTPAAIQLLPKGEYVLHWTSAAKSGTIELHLRQNERLIIPTQ